jgi:AraC-like DNA-binding protein
MVLPNGVFAFRFPGVAKLGLLDLFATGRQRMTDPDYRWHGLERTDGPLLLFQYTREGSGIIEFPDGRTTLGPGSAFLVEIPSDHVYRIDPEAGLWDLDFILLRPAHAENLWKTALGRLGPVSVFPSGKGPVAALETLIRAASEGRIRDPYEASSLTYQFLVSLVAHAARPDAEPAPVSVARAMELLDEGWNRPWKLPEVARAVGLSPAHFHRTFRRHTGITPLEWLTRRRIEKAVELLGEPAARVDSVARALGFADSGYFIRVFHRWTGTTPGALLANRSALTGSKIVLSTQEKHG